jgi:hypothetical protein
MGQRKDDKSSLESLSLSSYSNIVKHALCICVLQKGGIVIWYHIPHRHLFQMKLEKKRPSSMDKIMNKLRLAQKRAQDMRSSMLANPAHQVTRTSHKALSFRRTRQLSSLSGCFTCHAF